MLPTTFNQTGSCPLLFLSAKPDAIEAQYRLQRFWLVVLGMLGWVKEIHQPRWWLHLWDSRCTSPVHRGSIKTLLEEHVHAVTTTTTDLRAALFLCGWCMGYIHRNTIYLDEVKTMSLHILYNKCDCMFRIHVTCSLRLSSGKHIFGWTFEVE